MELTDEELTYKDKVGNSPIGKYCIYIDNNEMQNSITDKAMMDVVKGLLLETIKNAELLQNAKAVWESYNRRE